MRHAAIDPRNDPSRRAVAIAQCVALRSASIGTTCPHPRVAPPILPGNGHFVIELLLALVGQVGHQTYGLAACALQGAARALKCMTCDGLCWARRAGGHPPEVWARRRGSPHRCFPSTRTAARPLAGRRLLGRSWRRYTAPSLAEVTPSPTRPVFARLVEAAPTLIDTTCSTGFVRPHDRTNKSLGGARSTRMRKMQDTEHLQHVLGVWHAAMHGRRPPWMHTHGASFVAPGAVALSRARAAAQRMSGHRRRSSLCLFGLVWRQRRLLLGHLLVLLHGRRILGASSSIWPPGTARTRSIGFFSTVLRDWPGY